MAKTAIKIGPLNQGRRMTLKGFAQAGCLCELAQGVVTVKEIPDRSHLAQVNVLRRQLYAFDLAHPGTIHAIAGGCDCKIILAGLDSERHPDLAVYKSAPHADDDLWSSWIPEIVIEVVSPASADCDYRQKREEYLLFGVHEYWILDAMKQETLLLRRRGGQWSERIVRPPLMYRTSLLPGFGLDSAAIFQAANQPQTH